jgi:hypothetical protein
MKFILPDARSTSVAAALFSAAAALAFLPVAAADEDTRHIAVAPQDLEWAPNPAEAGPLALRLRFPAGYRIPAHSHPQIEHITVLSGVFNIGMGDVLDEEKGNAMPAGSFVVMLKGHDHFAWTEQETVVQLHSTGPWGITYVNPADDPRGSN